MDFIGVKIAIDLIYIYADLLYNAAWNVPCVGR